MSAEMLKLILGTCFIVLIVTGVVCSCIDPNARKRRKEKKAFIPWWEWVICIVIFPIYVIKLLLDDIK